MEELKLRILIQHVQGADIAYLYYREAFDLLDIPREDYDQSQFVEIGKEFTYEGTRYKIENINLKMYPETYEVDNAKGINLYSPTDLSDYNCQLGIFVSTVE